VVSVSDLSILNDSRNGDGGLVVIRIAGRMSVASCPLSRNVTCELKTKRSPLRFGAGLGRPHLSFAFGWMFVDRK
jgi:hypothetical protein